MKQMESWDMVEAECETEGDIYTSVTGKVGNALI